jgi:hypothetical protein
MDYSFFLRGRRRIVACRVEDGDTVFLRERRGIAVRDVVDGDTVFLRGLLGAAVRDVMDGETVLGSVGATRISPVVVAGDKTVLGDTTGVSVVATVGDTTVGTGSTSTVDACTCTTASSGGLFWPVSVTTSNRKRC